jgi:hypothetical protein
MRRKLVQGSRLFAGNESRPRFALGILSQESVVIALLEAAAKFYESHLLKESRQIRACRENDGGI